MRISPSKLDAWATCPCFEYVDSKEDKKSDAATEGTLLHAAMESDDDSLLENVEQRAAVTSMRNYREGIRSTMQPFAKEHRELRVTLFDGIKGTLDHVMWNNKEFHILDWKSGRLGIPVAAKDSRQLKGYLLGFLRFAKENFLSVPAIGHTHFVAPRTEEIDVADYVITPELEGALEAELRSVIATVDDPFKKPNNADPGQCAKCENAQRCPIVCRALVPVVSDSVAVSRPALLTTPVAELAPEDMGRFAVLHDLVCEWFDQRKKAINERVFAEQIDVPGFKRVEKSGSKRIEDVAAAAEALQGVLSLSQIFSCAKLSYSQLTKLDDKVEAVLDPYLVVGPSTHYIMRGRNIEVHKLLASR